jgi:hypothetical protein
MSPALWRPRFRERLERGRDCELPIAAILVEQLHH